MRHSDYDDLEPATLKRGCVVVNFFGTFVCYPIESIIKVTNLTSNSGDGIKPPYSIRERTHVPLYVASILAVLLVISLLQIEAFQR